MMAGQILILVELWIVGLAILLLLFITFIKHRVPFHRWVKSRVVKVTEHYKGYDIVNYVLYEKPIYCFRYSKAEFSDYERKDGEKSYGDKQRTSNNFSFYADCVNHIKIRREYQEEYFKLRNTKPDIKIVYDESENEKGKHKCLKI